MKSIFILTIIFSILLFPVITLAQTTTGTCRQGENGFVDWQKCLSGSKDGGGDVPIKEPVFINNAYQRFYNEVKQGAFCNLNNWDLGGNNSTTNVYTPSTTSIETCASKLVLDKFAIDIFALLLGIMFIIFCFLIFRSRIMYITAGDNEDQVKKSKKIATAAFVGFLFIFFGLIFGQILAGSIGSSLFDVRLFG